jgi:hypothetical protein
MQLICLINHVKNNTRCCEYKRAILHISVNRKNQLIIEQEDDENSPMFDISVEINHTRRNTKRRTP